MQTFVNPFPDALQPKLDAIGLLLMRLSLGGVMLYAHGWGKLTNYGERAASFPDPIGLGSQVTMSIAIFAEVFCSIAVIIGLFTRLSVLPLIGTMLVAFFVVHADDPFARKELALIYLTGYVLLLCKGAGAWSIDARLRVRGLESE